MIVLLLSTAFAQPPICAAEQAFHELARPADAPRHRPPHVRAVLEFAYDADDSGSLDEYERSTLLAGLEARCEAFADLIEVIDLDASGSLSESERVVLRERMGRPPGPPPGPPAGARGGKERGSLPPPLVHAYDTDGSGELEGKERAQARVDIRERLEDALPPFPHPSHRAGR